MKTKAHKKVTLKQKEIRRKTQTTKQKAKCTKYAPSKSFVNPKDTFYMRTSRAPKPTALPSCFGFLYHL